MKPSLDKLLSHPALFRGGDSARIRTDHLDSGFEELDTELPGGVWPVGALTELLLPRQGIGELRLLMPALARLSHEGRYLAWVAPPHLPYAPALGSGGVKLTQVLLIHAESLEDRLWAAEQALRSGACGAVLIWPKAIDDRDLRRLQLAAEAGHCWGVLFRPVQEASRPSPAALRVRLDPAPGSVRIDIIKRRGGWALGPLWVNLDVSQASYRVAPLPPRLGMPSSSPHSPAADLSTVVLCRHALARPALLPTAPGGPRAGDCP